MKKEILKHRKKAYRNGIIGGIGIGSLIYAFSSAALIRIFSKGFNRISICYAWLFYAS